MIFVEKAALKKGVEMEVVNVTNVESFRIEEYKDGSTTAYRIAVYFDGLSWERLLDGISNAEKAKTILGALINQIQSGVTYIKMSDIASE